MTERFWEQLDHLLKASQIVIDRPRGSRHPHYRDAIYPLDYGYLESTTGSDGHEIDIWSGSSTSRHLDAILCTVDLEKKDAEIKLLVGCSADEKRVVCDFHASANSAALLVERN